MDEKELDIRFLEAVETASKMSQSELPQDVQLRLYAYYKQASFGIISYDYSSEFDLRNALKPTPGCKSAIYQLTKPRNFT